MTTTRSQRLSAAALAALSLTMPAHSAPLLGKTILYITQVPLRDEVATTDVAATKMNITTTMQSPLADTVSAGRGGALWIRYSNGVTRNLTAAAGYGQTPVALPGVTFQGASSISVQHPVMHWDGTKAIFAMVVGAPLTAADATQFRWQLYEITSFGQAQTPVITKVPGQPAACNNIQACYESQDRIVFISDAPRGLIMAHYPPRDDAH